ncbi:glutamate racemase [Methylovorus menthalis]|uniref:glutamate racemase n=1 Tax=Methylovorus menthalis TaxID=1002227 RepID=UPI001E3952F8|nr:glutamate racemase [Methylovorus menthalis]MCB4811112.1 glutamate racemase [Methylovorus menthalis]
MLATSPSASQDIPVGVFDSGVGGLSVLAHIRQALPQQSLIYAADSLHAPYGSKSQAFIVDRSIQLSDFLISRGAKALVVACNTATAAAIGELRRRYAIPIVGMEPAVKPAAAATRSGVVGVLATSGTLLSAQFAALLESYGRQVRVETQACIGLVECIERGELQGAATRKLLQKYIAPLLEAGADTLVLGCTHYPFLRPLIEDIAGPDVVIIDTGAAVARQLKHRLQDANLLADGLAGRPGVTAFWSNADAGSAQSVISLLWGKSVEVLRLPD